ncbi:MAG: RES family NAD+ phosphorylase [Burkholderiaceae bacterium]|nr:RES family NAD+ phosphorylase [Burkholderiaceae bacterium]
MHTPRWATAPTSGAGAAAHRGRANRPGTPALYLTLEPETAVREYQQLSPLMPPGTLVSYTVRLAPVVDFRAAYDPTRWSDLWEEFHCDWRELWFSQRVEPPSWVLADEALASGAKGILFGSWIAPGGTNLVVLNDMLTSDDTLQVYDPTGALPKNQDSWR